MTEGIWLFMLQHADIERLVALGIESTEAIQGFVTIAIRATLAEMEEAKRERDSKRSGPRRSKRKTGGKHKCEN